MRKQIEIKNHLKFGVHWRLIAYHKGTGIIATVLEGHNMIVTDGLEIVTDMLIDASATWDVGLTYCELGTSAQTPVAGDAALVAASKRKAITSRSRSGVAGTFSTFFTAAESNIFIKEAGLWGGSAAAAGLGTGKLFARWLSSFDNSAALYDITIEYTLTPSY